MTDDIIPPFFSFFESLPQQGPGDTHIPPHFGSMDSRSWFSPVDYVPQKKLLTELRSEPRTPEDNVFLKGIEQEIHIPEPFPDIFGYVFV